MSQDTKSGYKVLSLACRLCGIQGRVGLAGLILSLSLEHRHSHRHREANPNLSTTNWHIKTHGRRHRAALIGERNSVVGAQGLVGVAVLRRPVGGAMLHIQTSELPKALNIETFVANEQYLTQGQFLVYFDCRF